MGRRRVSETLMVETSALVAIILEEPGWRQLAERIAAASAFTTCFNVFEALLRSFARRI
jgi:ribonuclease VapC